MDQYLTSVREAEIRTRRADVWLDTPLPKISDTDRQRTNRDIAATKAGDYFRTVYDLMVLAFQTDTTRVATFSLGGEGDAFAIPEIGITESRHQLSHHGGDTGYMEKLTNYDTFAIEQFSYFLSRLAETKDFGGKPLLDSTMSLFGSGMSYGHSHGNANLPLVLAGGKDLGLRHGTHLDFNRKATTFKGYTFGEDGALTTAHYQVCSRPVNTDAHMSNLLLLMAQRMGVSRSTLNTLENTGKASVTSWIKLVQCLGQEAQLQPLFKPVIASIADMEKQQQPARQRVTRKRLRPGFKP
jgi:hypothetical protein